MKTLALSFCLCVPTVVWGQAKVLIDAIPTAATFAGVTPIQMPFKDAASESPKTIEEGLNGAVTRMVPMASQQGFTYVCLLSAPGDQPIAIPISVAHADLKLSRTGTAVWALFYKDGHEPTSRIDYSTGRPEAKTAQVSTTFKEIAVPQGGSTAGWIYLNLPRIQAEAEKAKSSTVFLSVGGNGSATAVPIPGMKEALMVPEEQSTFTATWYMDPVMAATHKGELLGHPLPEGEAKTKP